MTSNQSIRMNIAGRLATLGEAVDEVLNAIDDNPELARGLDDRELLALVAWAGVADPADTKALDEECKRRHDEHAGQARRFAAFGEPS